MHRPEAEQRFPFVNLEKALARAQQLYDADQRGGDMAVPTSFSVWDYSEKSSGGFQTVSALKMYGLLVDAGAGENRRIRLSDDAMRYFRDEREEERQKLLREFALKPPLFHSLWSEWGSTPPSDTVARSQLKLERRLNEQSARAALGMYKDNLAFANIKGGATIPELDRRGATNGTKPEPPRQTLKVGDFVQWVSGDQDQFRGPRRVTWVSEEGDFLRVHGSLTGIPMDEVTLTDPPARQVRTPPSATSAGENDINVLLAGDRLQITADVDLQGIKRLKRILDMHLELLSDGNDG